MIDFSNSPAFPKEGCASTGLTKREYAAIHLRVPHSGDPLIDAMIHASLVDEMRRETVAAMVIHGTSLDSTNLAKVAASHVATVNSVFWPSDLETK